MANTSSGVRPLQPFARRPCACRGRSPIMAKRRVRVEPELPQRPVKSPRSFRSLAQGDQILTACVGLLEQIQDDGDMPRVMATVMAAKHGDYFPMSKLPRHMQ